MPSAIIGGLTLRLSVKACRELSATKDLCMLGVRMSLQAPGECVTCVPLPIRWFAADGYCLIGGVCSLTVNIVRAFSSLLVVQALHMPLECCQLAKALTSDDGMALLCIAPLLAC